VQEVLVRTHGANGIGIDVVFVVAPLGFLLGEDAVDDFTHFILDATF